MNKYEKVIDLPKEDKKSLIIDEIIINEKSDILISLVVDDYEVLCRRCKTVEDLIKILSILGEKRYV